MRKKFHKKLSLNKETVSDLNREEMGDVLGGTLFIRSCNCSESCSMFIKCCDDITQPLPEMIPGD